MLMSRRLKNKLLVARWEKSLVNCIKECMFVSKCKSVNYIRRFLLCELNEDSSVVDDSDLIRDGMSIHVDLQYRLTVCYFCVLCDTLFPNNSYFEFLFKTSINMIYERYNEPLDVTLACITKWYFKIKCSRFWLTTCSWCLEGPFSYKPLAFPWGTNCAPLLVDILWYPKEPEFIYTLSSKGRKHPASHFSFTYRYITIWCVVYQLSSSLIRPPKTREQGDRRERQKNIKLGYTPISLTMTVISWQTWRFKFPNTKSSFCN